MYNSNTVKPPINDRRALRKIEDKPPPKKDKPKASTLVYTCTFYIENHEDNLSTKDKTAIVLKVSFIITYSDYPLLEVLTAKHTSKAHGPRECWSFDPL